MPNTVTVQGVVVGVPVDEQVPESVMPLTVMFVELNALRSAADPDGRLLKSTIRNRNRVTGARC